MGIKNRILSSTLGLAALALPGITWAATCTVTPGDSGGPTQLRGCIAGAADGDTISIPSGVTVNLTAGQILIDKSLTIQGANDGTSIIDGSGNTNDRIFDINPSNPDKSVIITGLTLQKGNITDGRSGGAIFVDFNGGLRLENCLISNNTTNSSGGGVYNDGNLVIDNCTFSKNSATNGSGGGLANDGALLIANNTVFDQNSASGDGGAINNGGAAEISDVTLTFNTASDGGGIHNDTSLLLQNCKINNNSATGSYGGGVYNSSENILIDNCEIDNNTADEYGGGVYNDDNLVITNSHIHHNTATNTDGGGIYNGESATIINCEVNNNTSGSDGGGVFTSYTGFISASYIHDNQTTDGDGGGISNDEYLVVDSSRIEGNKAQGSGNDSGGIDNNCCELVLTNSSLTGNSAADVGGALYNDDHFVIVNTTISGNTAANDGGAIYNDSQGVINNSTIASNTATSGTGGGIYNNNIVSLSNSILANNSGGADPDCFNVSGDNLGSGGFNLIKTVSSNCVLSGNTSTNVAPGTDPQLSAPADNGGPFIGTPTNPVRTLTMALATTSPAIDKGDNDTCETTDQRGVSRPQQSACDIGAFEYAPIIPIPTPTATPVPPTPFINGGGCNLGAAPALGGGLFLGLLPFAAGLVAALRRRVR
ncbi:MAG: choice-of-anchor Q domain-containing protein [bacterium]